MPHDLSYSNGRLNPSNGTLGIYYPDTEELKLVWESSYGILYQESRKRNEILVGVKKLGKLLEEANLILKSSSGITTPLQTQDENFRHSTSRAITFDARKIVNVSELIIKLDEQSKQDTLRYIEEWEELKMTLMITKI